MQQARRTLLIVVLAVLTFGSNARAHVVLQGSSLDVVIHHDYVSVTAHLTSAEVPVDDSLPPSAEVKQEELENYGYYLTAHLHLVATGGEGLSGKLVRAVPGDAKSKRGVCELEYRSDSSPPVPMWQDGSTKAFALEIRDTVMQGRQDLEQINVSGIAYAVRISVEGGKPKEGLLLTDDTPITFEFAAAGVILPPSQAGNGVVGPYVRHGVMHILTGYDHILFVTALVLAAATLWDLVKVVSVFTLAHTITLFLAAFDVVRLPSAIVEPFIAASIVFIAVQNAAWPDRSRGNVRLAAAFFFGLFHGLGFAGGLLDAMQGMSGGVAVLAIASFSLGVELGHQIVVLPLYAGLAAVRGWKKGIAAPPDRGRQLVMRVGSALIAVAGVYYFGASLHLVPMIGE